jgi:hypothetical protein
MYLKYNIKNKEESEMIRKYVETFYISSEEIIFCSDNLEMRKIKLIILKNPNSKLSLSLKNFLSECEEVSSPEVLKMMLSLEIAKQIDNEIIKALHEL